MRKSVLLILAVLLVGTALPVSAEVQNVVVGGSIKIRGNYYANTYTSPVAADLRWAGGFLPRRPIGDILGGQTITSPFDWDHKTNDSNNVEQYTRLNVRADFSSEVSAFIELDSYDIWGEDFRSSHITGVDGRADTADDLEVYQAYIEAREMFGHPLRTRIGRQELAFGNEWLVGTGGTAAGLFKHPFDAIRLTYATDQYSVDAWWSKLADTSPLEQDGDVDFYGVYASYLGIEDITIDAYWMLVRDGRQLNDTDTFPFGLLREWVEDWVGLDDYDPMSLHTIGLRGAGTYGAFDFNAELAYQFGDAGPQGILFNNGRPFPFLGFTYGDDGANFSNWAANLEAGYTFDMNYSPRVYMGAAYFGGEDNRDINFWQWLNPFDRSRASVSFNRLFSSWEYSEFIEGTDLSNAWVLRGGVKVQPTESTEVLLALSYFEAVEPFSPPRHITFGQLRIPILPALSFWDQENSSDLGFEVGLYGTYRYSEDLTFQAGWAHLFVRDGLYEGSFSHRNGLHFNGGNGGGNDDADYVFFETSLAF